MQYSAERFVQLSKAETRPTRTRTRDQRIFPVSFEIIYPLKGYGVGHSKCTEAWNVFGRAKKAGETSRNRSCRTKPGQFIPNRLSLFGIACVAHHEHLGPVHHDDNRRSLRSPVSRYNGLLSRPCHYLIITNQY